MSRAAQTRDQAPSTKDQPGGLLLPSGSKESPFSEPVERRTIVFAAFLAIRSHTARAQLLLCRRLSPMDPRQFARSAGLAPRIETCWTLLGPSRRPLTCGIYRTDVGLEVRVGYTNRAPIYSKNERQLTAARETATELLDAVNEADVFAEMCD